MVKKSLFLSILLVVASYSFAQDEVELHPVDTAEVMDQENSEQDQELNLENLLKISSALQEFYVGLSQEEQVQFGLLLDALRGALYEVSETLESVVERHTLILNKLKDFIGASKIAFRISLHAE